MSLFVDGAKLAAEKLALVGGRTLFDTEYEFLFFSLQVVNHLDLGAALA